MSGENERITIGIVAHVDAGKTSLSESLLYESGVIRRVGRVDHGDSCLDTDEVERKRGITIYSSRADFQIGQKTVTLLDTPGHTDFVAETERVFSVLDYAVLLISASEGVQSHTKTLWKLLEKYSIPLFVFFNKMDIARIEEKKLLAEMMETFGDGFISFSCTKDEKWWEELALTDEKAMEQVLEEGRLTETQLAEMVEQRKLFPCFFGSALKQEGISDLLEALEHYTLTKSFGSEFAARVFKISTDDKGNRLTHMRITGGSLCIRHELSGKSIPDQEDSYGNDEQGGWSEKVSEIRCYRGAKYESVQEARAGEVVTVLGLSRTKPGMGLGAEHTDIHPSMLAVLTYQIFFVGNVNMASAYRRILVLEDELPELSLRWDAQASAIFVNLMGEIQTEILASVLHDRFGYVVEFGPAKVSYRETIADTVEGVGHFEPLRHYAEVHLKLEPNVRGGGMEFALDCQEDLLAVNWQRLILTHLKERIHRGVLTGSPITDVKISVVAGKAHRKHTMGGDFRQATYRAVRQGLMKANSLLLEPYYRFCLEIPQSQIGRAMTDIEGMCGQLQPPETDGARGILRGVAPVSEMHGYANVVMAYTGGEGRLSLSIDGYRACHNPDQVIEEYAYDSDADIENPTGSVFCAHGAGFVVPWDQVDAYMHLERALDADDGKSEGLTMPIAVPRQAKSNQYQGTLEEDKELESIFVREFGPVKRHRFTESKEIISPSGPDLGHSSEKYHKKAEEKEAKKRARRKKYLLVDGYNVIHTWEELKQLAEVDLAGARDRLADLLCNYQGYTGIEIILVFDAYKVSGNPGSVTRYHNIYLIYTKEAETADAYIERATHEIAKEHDVTVVTSDGLVQLIVLGSGAIRMSSREFLLEMEKVRIEGMRYRVE